MSNHDGLYFDVFDEDSLPQVVSILLTHLEDFGNIIHNVFGVELKVPFEWDLKVGPNLLETKERAWD